MSDDKYYWISNGDGETYIEELTKGQLVGRLNGEDPEYRTEFLDSIPDGDTNYWGDKSLLIRGQIVVPRDVEVVTRRDVE